MTDETIEPSRAERRSREDEWRQRYFEARDALFQFKYPPDPKLLREIADEIDCGSDCEHGNTEWDTNAHVCSRSERKGGCAGEKASCLRQFADAIDIRSAAVDPTGGVTSPEYVMVPKRAIDWLMGMGPDANGNHFGDEEAYNTRRGRYWWRSEFRSMLSAAPPSPRSDDGSGLTPSEHGSSAALRAQVIEECAKVADGRATWYARSYSSITDQMQAHYRFMSTACEEVAKVIRNLSDVPAVPAIAQERDVGELIEDIDEAADDLIDSVQYLQETMAAGEGVYESKWIGGVMSAHEMLLRLSEHIKHADAWPCDGEGDEHGNFVCKKDRDVGKPVAYRIDLGHGFNYYDAAPGKYEKLQTQGRPIQALYLTTSPSAISEAPTSAAAVTTPTPSEDIT